MDYTFEKAFSLANLYLNFMALTEEDYERPSADEVVKLALYVMEHRGSATDLLFKLESYLESPEKLETVPKYNRRHLSVAYVDFLNEFCDNESYLETYKRDVEVVDPEWKCYEFAMGFLEEDEPEEVVAELKDFDEDFELDLS